MGRRHKKPLMGKYALSGRPAQQESPGIGVKVGRDIWTNRSVTVKAFDVAKFEKQQQQLRRADAAHHAAATATTIVADDGDHNNNAHAHAGGTRCRGDGDDGGAAVVGLFRELIKFEIATLSKTNGHPNVVQLVDVLASPTGNKIFVVMETVSGGGDLFEAIAAEGRLEEDMSRRYFGQLLDAVEHCHSRGVCHRDIKPENVLLDARGNVKLTGFALAGLFDPSIGDNHVENLLHATCGTADYAAPEVIQGFAYNGKAADLWSLGVTLYTMLAGYLPFEAENLAAVFNKAQVGDFKAAPGMSTAARSLIDCMLEPDPEERFTAAQVRSHPWFAAQPQQQKQQETTSPCQDETRLQLAHAHGKSAHDERTGGGDGGGDDNDCTARDGSSRGSWTAADRNINERWPCSSRDSNAWREDGVRSLSFDDCCYPSSSEFEEEEEEEDDDDDDDDEGGRAGGGGRRGEREVERVDDEQEEELKGAEDDREEGDGYLSIQPPPAMSTANRQAERPATGDGANLLEPAERPATTSSSFLGCIPSSSSIATAAPSVSSSRRSARATRSRRGMITIIRRLGAKRLLLALPPLLNDESAAAAAAAAAVETDGEIAVETDGETDTGNGGSDALALVVKSLQRALGGLGCACRLLMPPPHSPTTNEHSIDHTDKTVHARVKACRAVVRGGGGRGEGKQREGGGEEAEKAIVGVFFTVLLHAEAPPAPPLLPPPGVVCLFDRGGETNDESGGGSGSDSGSTRGCTTIRSSSNSSNSSSSSRRGVDCSDTTEVLVTLSTGTIDAFNAFIDDLLALPFPLGVDGAGASSCSESVEERRRRRRSRSRGKMLSGGGSGKRGRVGAPSGVKRRQEQQQAIAAAAATAVGTVEIGSSATAGAVDNGATTAIAVAVGCGKGGAVPVSPRLVSTH